jgi:hypothetical protein
MIDKRGLAVSWGRLLRHSVLFEAVWGPMLPGERHV